MAFAALLKKEVMVVLKNPAFIGGIVLLVVYFGVLGRVVGVATEQAAREVLASYVGLVNEDLDAVTLELIRLANATLGGRLVAVSSVEEGLRAFSVVVLVPRGFAELLLTPGLQAHVRGYVTLDSLSMAQQARVQLVGSVARVLEELGRAFLAARKGVDVSEITKTVTARVETRVGSRVVDARALPSLMLSVTMFLYLVGLLGMMSLVYSAQSVAAEKEEKAFEMLLTLPVGRTTIAVAKIAGATIISALMVLAYFVGFSAMLTPAGPQAEGGEAVIVTGSIQDLVRLLGAEGTLLLSLSVGLSLMFSGSLGLLIGSVSSDTRVAGALAGPVGAAIFLGLFAAQFVGVPLGPAAVTLGATVYGLPLALLASWILGDYLLAVQALGLAVATTLAAVLSVVRVFRSERILVGFSLLRRRPRRW